MQGQTSSYVITTLMTAPSSSALTTLANVKDDLDIEDDETDDDNRLTRYITEESAAIARHCNRVFGLATWRDEFRPQRGVRGEGVRSANNPLQLTKWPLATGVTSFTGNTHPSKLVDGISSTTGLTTGSPVFGAGIPAGATICEVAPFSVLLSAPATVAATGVALTAGMSVIETVAGVDTQLVAGTDFEIDMGSGLPGDEGVARLYRLNEHGNPRTWPATKITVVYQAGYVLPGAPTPSGVPTMPSDLESACLRVVVGRFRAKGRDPMLVERNQGQIVGTERYWVGSSPGQTGAFAPEIEALIRPYRVPVIA